MKLIDADALLEEMQHHLDSTYMSVCSSVEECKARRYEIQLAIEMVNTQPPVEVKLRTNEDILSVDEAIKTINRLRKAYRKQKIIVYCKDCVEYNAPVVSRDIAVCGRLDRLVEPDGYCSWGKKRCDSND